jgi:hypothetical protein
MEFKLDFGKTKDDAIAVMRDREKFWKKLPTPKDIGPLLSYLAVIAIAPFLGYLIAFGWFSATLGLTFGIVQYIMAVLTPFIGGLIMSILSEAMNLGKGKFLDFSTLAAYSATPGILLGFLVFLPFLGGILGLLGALFGLYLLYLGLMHKMGMKSDKAIIFLIIYLIVWIVISWLITISVIGGGVYGLYTGRAAMLY